MKKIYVREVTKCRECPECSRFMKWCFMMRRETENTEAIPDWCPLEDVEKGKD